MGLTMTGMRRTVPSMAAMKVDKSVAGRTARLAFI